MRDRTAARNYSPAGEEFRREHQRHRDWGLTQRHAERLRRVRGADRDSRTPTVGGSAPEPVAPTSTPFNQAVRPTASPAVAAGQHHSGGAKKTIDQPGTPAGGLAQPGVVASARPSGYDSSQVAENMPVCHAENAAEQSATPAEGLSQPAAEESPRPTKVAPARRARNAPSRPAKMHRRPNSYLHCRGPREAHLRGPPRQRRSVRRCRGHTRSWPAGWCAAAPCCSM
jgi:hypothetical protein